MKDLDPDALTITSWVQYAQDCSEAGQTWRFQKKLADHIYFTNKRCQEEIKAYCVGRMGDWARQELDEVIWRKKQVREMRPEWNMLKLQIKEVFIAYVVKTLRKNYLNMGSQ